MDFTKLEEGKDYLVRHKGENWVVWHAENGLLTMRIERENVFKMCCFYTKEGQLHSKRNPMVAERNFELENANVTQTKNSNEKKVRKNKKAR